MRDRTAIGKPRGRHAIALGAVALSALLVPVMPGEARASTSGFSAPVRVLANCAGATTCPEPTITEDAHGRLYVMYYGAQDIAVVDNGQVVHRAGPKPVYPILGDAIINSDGAGRLFVAGLVYPLGVQVWRSLDEGRTWGTSVIAPVAGADRPWLGFGPNGRVYLTYKIGLQAEAVQASSDNGATFGPPVLAMPPNRSVGVVGPPVVDRAGRLLFALGTFDPLGRTPQDLLLAVSNDGGQTFSYRPIAVQSAPAGEVSYFPILSLGSAGVLRAAWSRPAAAQSRYDMVVATSADGGSTWGSPVSWSGSDTLTSSPAIAPVDGALKLLWYRVTSPGAKSSLVFARGTADGTHIERTVVADGIVARPSNPAPRNEANTDFAQFALLPDGRAAVVWSDNGVWLSIEDRASRSAAGSVITGQLPTTSR